MITVPDRWSRVTLQEIQIGCIATGYNQKSKFESQTDSRDVFSHSG